MDANNSKSITNEMLMEQFMEMKSMIANLHSEIESLKNPVDSFLAKWIDTFEAMRMLCVSRRTMDNYIKAGKLTPVRINKRNHFAVTEVNGLVHVPESPKIKSYQEDIRSMLQQVAKMDELGEDW
ncbi:MAG: helix-turn-helix domain-containing protein [Chitinophagaceae bacterium]|jgi:Holliday junction resolvase RusA-like endonuclease|nr:helix-turn-helix domain-containing protein [Chitinophagaceae bacterium]MCE2972227.1 helix-turn-helix domain-containing protein [Sediminibacterium sp.]